MSGIVAGSKDGMGWRFSTPSPKGCALDTHPKFNLACRRAGVEYLPSRQRSGCVHLGGMRYALALMILGIHGTALAQAPAPSDDDISRALGGNSWLPPAARPRSPADPANRGASGSLPEAAPPDSADAIPLHNVDAACEALARRTPRDGLATRNGSLRVCLQEEQDGYDTARMFWDTLTPEQHRECLQHAGGFGLPNYYRALGVCAEGKAVAAAVSSQSRQPPQRFQY